MTHSSAGDVHRDEVTKAHEIMFSAFSDNLTVIEDQVAEVDRVVTRATWSAIHSGTYRGISPTGKRIHVALIVVDRVKSGKIVESWEMMDRYSLMQQLR